MVLYKCNWCELLQVLFRNILNRGKKKVQIIIIIIIIFFLEGRGTKFSATRGVLKISFFEDYVDYILHDKQFNMYNSSLNTYK